MFGRRLAITLVKANDNNGSSTEEPMNFEKLGETIVETSAGVASVIVLTAAALTILRVTEIVAKYAFR